MTRHPSSSVRPYILIASPAGVGTVRPNCVSMIGSRILPHHVLYIAKATVSSTRHRSIDKTITWKLAETDLALDVVDEETVKMWQGQSDSLLRSSKSRGQCNTTFTHRLGRRLQPTPFGRNQRGQRHQVEAIGSWEPPDKGQSKAFKADFAQEGLHYVKRQ